MNFFLNREILASPLKKKESLPLKIKVVQVTSFCLTSFPMLRVMPAMKSLTFPQYTPFFTRTRKFCLRLAVLNFFSFLRLKCSYIVISPTEPCNATKQNVRLSTVKTHYFISFILFLSSSTQKQPLGGVLHKSCSATVVKPIKKFDQKIPQKSSIFH